MRGYKKKNTDQTKSSRNRVGSLDSVMSCRETKEQRGSKKNPVARVQRYVAQHDEAFRGSQSARQKNDGAKAKKREVWLVCLLSSKGVHTWKRKNG